MQSSKSIDASKVMHKRKLLNSIIKWGNTLSGLSSARFSILFFFSIWKHLCRRKRYQWTNYNSFFVLISSHNHCFKIKIKRFTSYLAKFIARLSIWIIIIHIAYTFVYKIVLRALRKMIFIFCWILPLSTLLRQDRSMTLRKQAYFTLHYIIWQTAPYP